MRTGSLNPLGNASALGEIAPRWRQLQIVLTSACRNEDKGGHANELHEDSLRTGSHGYDVISSDDSHDAAQFMKGLGAAKPSPNGIHT